MTSLGERVVALERRVTWLTICLAVFVVLHGFLIPLLPRLFSHAAPLGVAALVMATVVFAFVVVRRAR